MFRILLKPRPTQIAIDGFAMEGAKSLLPILWVWKNRQQTIVTLTDK
jgi:hypothetical protein